MELASDLATHFGHEGPTHDIPGPGTYKLPTLSARGKSNIPNAPTAARACARNNERGSTPGNAAALLLKVGSTSDDRKTKSH